MMGAMAQPATGTKSRRHHLVLLDTGEDGYRVVDSGGILDRPAVRRASFEQWLARLVERGWTVASDARSVEPAGRVVILDRPKPAR